MLEGVEGKGKMQRQYVWGESPISVTKGVGKRVGAGL